MTTTSDLVRALVIFLFTVLGSVHAQVVYGGEGVSRPTFIITSPKRARYDTLTTISVSASNVVDPASIGLILRTGSANEIVLNETSLHFQTDGVQTWGVVIDSDRMFHHQQRRMQLKAEYGNVVKVMELPMNPLSGFIMIQTDKVIYTPRQTVMYRIIALDDDQRFARWPVVVDIKNPDLIILERQHHSSRDAFMGRNFTLPRDATAGAWSITAYYDGIKVRTTKSINFDVEEYVLPTFKVEVTAVEKVIALSTNWVQVKTKAVYSYGRPVHGSAVLRLGVVGRTKVALFNDTYPGMLDQDGQWDFQVPVADMRRHSSWFPDGARLYVSVNVTEEGTGEVGTAVAMDTYFANPYYRILFDSSKEYFKPGFFYNLVVDVRAASGAPASNINVYIITGIKDENGDDLDGYSSLFELDEHGRLVERIRLPPHAAALHFQVYTVDPRVPDWAFNETTIHQFPSSTHNYLHLHYAQEDHSLNISYTPPTGFNYGAGHLITVLMMSRGRMVHNFTVPRNQAGFTRYPLSQDVLLAAAPVTRVLAFFYVTNMSTTELVSDALVIDTPDTCREELQLNRVSMGHHGAQLELLPKQQTELDILGGANMRVGLLAVDRAVYFLRDERSLSRHKVFSALGEADEGFGIGDGKNAEKNFESSGLQYMKLTATLDLGPPVVDNVLDLSQLGDFFPDVRKGEGLYWAEVESDGEEIPLEAVRRYFPESWLFHEVTLSRDGFRSEPITMPDSITTWIFTAVGVGADGGVCMSRPMELTTFKPFFAQVRLPYKAVRLEAVTVNIGIYNYKSFDINVTVTVRGDLGLCIADSLHSQQEFAYATLLRARQTNSKTVKIIPLVAGSVKLLVDVRAVNGRERDTVEKTLHVVAEGRRVQKSITFPLDPSGEHSTHQSENHNGVQRTRTATITNRINSNHQRQLTDIHLYMPEEVIHGSERCQISACGDLMGDIISTSVLDGDSLFESSIVDAEEAIGNLAPPVHALQYLSGSHFLTPEIRDKGQRYVNHGVSRLLTYRKQDGSFSLTPDSPPATWLTSLVLKTLCHAERITFVDHEGLVMRGFAWLLDQVNRDGTLQEQDHRLARPSREYELMLLAETLIALQECTMSRNLTDDDYLLFARLVLALGEHVHEIRSPLVMAKTAYALTLSDPTGSNTTLAVTRLTAMKRTTPQGLHYWSVSPGEDEPPNRPFWYHSGSKASSIEATAYALLVHVKQRQHLEGEGEGEDLWNVMLDGIAGWLIQKRNSRGAFIGAMDTAAATQALSEYSVSKVGVSEVNLHCNVTTNPTRNYSHSFDFNADNAITPKSLSNVPVGRKLRVETRGTGLGQMQVRVEYNVPVEANADCRYNVTVTRRSMFFSPQRLDGDEVCQYCNMGCDDDDDDGDNGDNNDDNININNRNSGRSLPVGMRPDRGHRGNRRQRPTRQIHQSRVTICIEVCIRSTDNMYADRTIVDIGMLSGFQPIKQDLERVYDKKEALSLSSLIYVPERTSVELKFNQIPHNRSTCVSFRAIERQDVDRRNPALVSARSHEDPEPTCVLTYDPVVSEVNLELYCASNQSNNQGQCRCFSGLCGQCYTRSDEVSFNNIRMLACNSEYIYKIDTPAINLSDDWVEMTADVIDVPKNGSVAVGRRIQLVTPRSCTCPYRAGFNAPHFFFGSQVDVFVDSDNLKKKTYVVDHTTTFVSATSNYNRDPNRISNFISMALQACGN